MEDNIKAFPILTLKQVNLHRVHEGHKETIFKNSPLLFLYVPVQNCCSLSINTFSYILSPEIPVIKHGKHSLYAFPDLNAYYGVELIPGTPLEEVRTFEKLLKENACFAVVNEQTLINERPKQADNDKLEEEKSAAPKTRYDKISDYFSKGAEAIKDALIKGAELLSVAIKVTGDYIREKLVKKRAKPVKVGKTTQALIQGAKIATGVVVDVSRKSV